MPVFLQFKSTLFLWVLVLMNCGDGAKTIDNKQSADTTQPEPIIFAADRMELYLDQLKDKRVGVVANQTSIVTRHHSKDPSLTHLVDTLLSRGITIPKVFAPEHGFRGTADAGEKVLDGIDEKTGIPIISLYGSNRKPTSAQLEGVDLLLFDIQDVGVRFYTYIATMQFVMEAAAENDIPVMVLDRPNPNGHYIDGPTLLPENRGFLGLNPIPLVYGMTIGEYARMINEEGWLEGNIESELTVIPLKNYTHESRYELPIRPSPNLPNATSVNLYPSLGLFEGTHINAGRGTEFQFQRYGAPFLDTEIYSFTYTPKSNFGAKYPKFQDETCYGEDLTATSYLSEVRLDWLIEAYKNTPKQEEFFKTEGFTKHAGTAVLQEQIEAGWTADQIKKSWQSDLDAFRAIRKKYLLYP